MDVQFGSSFLLQHVAGLKEEHFYIMLFLLGIILLYLVIYPFVQWFVRWKSSTVLSYIISSLVIICLVTWIGGALGFLTDQVLKMTLQGLAIFGIVLALAAVIIRLYKWVK